MKALILAAALAALSSAALAGASRENHPKSDPATVALIADAGQLPSTGLTTLNDGSPWNGPSHSGDDAGLDAMTAQVEPGYLLMALCVLAMALSRPVGRLLRRREQQRRATALASTLGHQLHH